MLPNVRVEDTKDPLVRDAVAVPLQPAQTIMAYAPSTPVVAVPIPPENEIRTPETPPPVSALVTTPMIIFPGGVHWKSNPVRTLVTLAQVRVSGLNDPSSLEGVTFPLQP